MLKLFKKLLSYLEKYPRFKRYTDEIIGFRGTERKFALSIATGIFIGTAMPPGFQIMTAVPLAMFLRANVLIACFFTLISNPFTFPPIIYTSFRLGSYVTGISMQWKVLSDFISNPTSEQFLLIGGTGFGIYMLGGLIQALIYTPVSYLCGIYLYRNLPAVRKKREE
ncbi:MAG: DUF2062 domain-containing protein [Ignavibacteriaceae bacterium]|nr:DUF2062 domain-containing protein [Ignavibacteriaceae bacterium]